MNDSSIAVLAHADRHPPHLAVGSLQPLRGRYLRQMLLLDLMPYFQPIPFSLAQLDALRFHRPLGHL
jgi:hypothetical protein